MKSKKIFYITSIVFFIFVIVPGIAFCDLKPLEDNDLSKIEAQSGFSEKGKGLLGDEKPGELFDCVTGENGSCGVNGAGSCSSTGADCFNNEPFTVNYPNPTQTNYINQFPSCRSGGCGK